MNEAKLPIEQLGCPQCIGGIAGAYKDKHGISLSEDIANGFLKFMGVDGTWKQLKLNDLLKLRQNGENLINMFKGGNSFSYVNNGKETQLTKEDIANLVNQSQNKNNSDDFYRVFKEIEKRRLEEEAKTKKILLYGGIGIGVLFLMMMMMNMGGRPQRVNL